MSYDVILPKTGIYTDDVLLLEWHVEEGEQVAPGTSVFTMVTDKVEVEVESEYEGWLHQLVPANSEAPIGTRVGVIAETREEYESLASGF